MISNNTKEYSQFTITKIDDFKGHMTCDPQTKELMIENDN